MTSVTDPPPPERRDREIQERVHDPYRMRAKAEGPAVCPQCGVVYEAGLWQWKKAPPPGAGELLCPACQRIRDALPAGEIAVHGSFAAKHRNDIDALIRDVERVEKEEHPLNRIMEQQWTGARLKVTTTDIHLARRIGSALYDAYRGTLRYRYPAEEYFLRVDWSRDK
ncbi:MAG: hypothetical protein LDL44_08310 [Caenispirillum sp.]|nr:hypothetical protein [Caenispirillum sp.]